jgi:ribonuclease Z
LQITILGTSSAVPTFRRSLSATLLDRGAECFLFDCGEATQFQLMRAGARRGRLRHIFITHLHGDHVFGLAGLLSSLALNQRDVGVDIHGPVGIKRYVDFFRTFPKRMTYSFPVRVHEIPTGFEGEVASGKGWTVTTIPLLHRVPTQGYRFEEAPRPGEFDGEKADELGVPFGPQRGELVRGSSVTLEDGRVIAPEDVVGPSRPGRTFVYCTDTGYCVNAKRLAQDCDLLLHETTYADDFAHLAEERMHSTIRQAASVARAARARQFVATHFSTRYDKHRIKDLEAEGREVYPDLIMAKDLMTLEV